MVTRIALGLAVVLALGAQGCVALGWYAEGGDPADQTPVFGNDPEFATCTYDATPPNNPAGVGACQGLDGYDAYHCTTEPSRNPLGYGCTLAAANLLHYICCPPP